MVSLIKGNGPECAGRFAAAAAGRTAGRLGDRIVGGAAAGRSGHPGQRGGSAGEKGTDPPDGTGGSETGTGEKVSADVSGLQRAGCGRSTDGLESGVDGGKDANAAVDELRFWIPFRGVLFLYRGSASGLL